MWWVEVPNLRTKPTNDSDATGLSGYSNDSSSKHQDASVTASALKLGFCVHRPIATRHTCKPPPHTLTSAAARLLHVVHSSAAG
jgi:hypothetical protein